MALKEKKKELPKVPSTKEFRDLEQDVAQKQANAEQRGRELSVIDTRYLLSDEAYDRERLEAEIAMHGQIIGEQFYHVGRKLLVLKEHEGHGYFGEMLDRLGLNRRTAQAWMRAAVTVDKIKSADSAHLGRQKLLELATLSDDELEALGEGQTVANLTLDELDKMSYSELKTQVRGHKAEKEAIQKAADDAFARKNKEIDERDKEILKLQKELATPSKATQKALMESAIDKKMLGIKMASDSVQNAYHYLEATILDLCKVEGIGFAELSACKEEIAMHLEPFLLCTERLDNGMNNLRPWREGDGQTMFEEGI